MRGISRARSPTTLASTGTPAFFVHPAEASHGDLGMVTREDALIALSNSGESAELLAIVAVAETPGCEAHREDRQRDIIASHVKPTCICTAVPPKRHARSTLRDRE